MVDVEDSPLAYHPFQKILDYFTDLDGQTPVKVVLWDDGFTCDVYWENEDGKLTLTTAGHVIVSRSSSVYEWE